MSAPPVGEEFISYLTFPYLKTHIHLTLNHYILSFNISPSSRMKYRMLQPALCNGTAAIVCLSGYL
jgi:hypothetical protein